MTALDPARMALAAWCSPSFPSGGFAFSHGLEQAVAAGDVSDEAGLLAWLTDVLRHGAGRADAILLAAAYRARAEGDAAALHEVAELAAALAPSAERRLETTLQGAAFAQTLREAWSLDVGSRDIDAAAPTHPIAVGAAAAMIGAALNETAALYLFAFAQNLIHAGQRLGLIGQVASQRLLRALIPTMLAIVDEALTAELDDLGGAGFLADIASMRHETQTVRLFRS